MQTQAGWRLSSPKTQFNEIRRRNACIVLGQYRTPELFGIALGVTGRYNTVFNWSSFSEQVFERKRRSLVIFFFADFFKAHETVKEQICTIIRSCVRDLFYLSVDV